MPIVLHDSGRSGKVGWAVDSVNRDLAAGMILSPFETPPDDQPRRPSAETCIGDIGDVGGEVFFDPTTHGVLAPGADKFEYYDEWDLWPGGSRGSLTATAVRRHVDRAMEVQRGLGVTPIAPTLALDSPTSARANIVEDMASMATTIDESAYVAVAGSARFWSAGVDLDAFIGSLARLRPSGWVVTATRESMRYPWPGLDPEEVFGICRTVHGASLRGARVICAQGDLAALPAVAAGADTVGSGWDVRHRMCADDMFRDEPGIRRTSERITHQGLLASLKRPEAERILAGDTALSRRLVPGNIPVGMKPQWRHHLGVAGNAVERIATAGTRRQRVDELRGLYQDVRTNFSLAEPLAAPMEAGFNEWVAPLSAGLEQYAASEGW